MASATFTMNGSATTAAVTASASSTCNLALTDTDGVNNVAWSIIGNNNPASVTSPTITATGTPSGVAAHFSIPADPDVHGQSFVVKCVVNGGVDGNGNTVAAYTKTGIVGTLCEAGIVPFSSAETIERDAIGGYTRALSLALDAAAAGGIVIPLQLNDPALGATVGSALNLWNATAAAAGAQQFSPAIRLHGYGWKTDATAASQAVDFYIQVQPIQAAAAPEASLAFIYQLNGGATVNLARLSNTSGLVFDKDAGGGVIAIDIQTAAGNATGLQLRAQVPTNGNGAGVNRFASSGVGTTKNGGSIADVLGAGTGGTDGSYHLYASNASTNLWQVDYTGAGTLTGALTLSNLAGSKNLLYVTGGSGAVLSLANPSTGAVLVYGASAPQWLAPDADGKVLTMVSGAPAWA